MQNLLLFHRNNGRTNVPRCYVISTARDLVIISVKSPRIETDRNNQGVIVLYVPKSLVRTCLVKQPVSGVANSAQWRLQNKSNIP